VTGKKPPHGTAQYGLHIGEFYAHHASMDALDANEKKLVR